MHRSGPVEVTVNNQHVARSDGSFQYVVGDHAY